MPIYMDAHTVPGVRARDVAEAHRLDLAHQHEYGCTCMTYWIDEHRERVFCLIDAPDKDAVRELHRKAHGLIPHKIIEVSSSMVQAFLGRLYDPEDIERSPDGLPVFADSAFRVLLVARSIDPALLCHRHGAEESGRMLLEYHRILRGLVASHAGSEVERNAPGLIFSFPGAAKALSCAHDILSALPSALAEAIDLRMGLTAGEAIESSNELFGDAIASANRLCSVARRRLAVDQTVRELVSKERIPMQDERMHWLDAADEALLRQLFDVLEEEGGDPDFDAAAFCRKLALSKSQLYRKCVELTGHSPNNLLKQHRLEKARELLKRKGLTVAQVAFDTGFTSPSYFTKCFRQEYGLQPVAYLELLG